MRPDWILAAAIAIVVGVNLWRMARGRRGEVDYDLALLTAASATCEPTAPATQRARLSAQVATFERLVAANSAQLKRAEQLLDEQRAA